VYYAYGDKGERTELRLHGQGTVYYDYGPTGLMNYVLDGKTGKATYYEYDPAGRVRWYATDEPPHPAPARHEE